MSFLWVDGLKPSREAVEAFAERSGLAPRGRCTRACSGLPAAAVAGVTSTTAVLWQTWRK